MHSRILLGVGLLGFVGCGVFGSDASAPPPAAIDAPPPVMQDDGGGLPEGAPPPAVGTPANNELTNEFGVFVTASAPTGGDGTMAHPFATISAGIERVKDLKLRVYVCAGLYRESLTLVNAVSVVGSLGCENGAWHTGGAATHLEAPTSPALRAKEIVQVTRFEGFDVEAPAGAAGTPNSIGLIAQNAPALTIVNTKLTAAKAFDGADGTDGVQLTLGASAKGTDGLPTAGPGLLPPATPIPYQTGRAGGVGSCVGAAGHDGENGGKGGNGATQRCEPSTFAGNPICNWSVVAGYDSTAPVSASSAAGGAGADGASASTVGAFSSDGYAPAGGTPGADGAPGKGGSGGSTGGVRATIDGPENSNKYFECAAGPGGGAGGCPGLAGAPGGGGGASVAALVLASPGLTFMTSQLVAGTGGAGGKGTFGSMSTAGGAPGVNNQATPGAAGGPGGRAGFSGNGAGGPSVALAYTGGAVVITPDSHTSTGAPGAGVPARTNPTTNVTIPASASGSAMPVVQF
jgi:hypothetical protein